MKIILGLPLWLQGDPMIRYKSYLSHNACILFTFSFQILSIYFDTPNNPFSSFTTIVTRRRSIILIWRWKTTRLHLLSLQTKCQKLFKVRMRNCLVSAIVLENCMFILNKICFCSLRPLELIFCGEVLLLLSHYFIIYNKRFAYHQ